jgi:hypothetical protein
MNIGFWNINKKDISDLLVDFVNEQQLDILLIAESEEKTILDFLIKNNKKNSSRLFNQISSDNTKVSFLSSYPISQFVNKSKLFISQRWSAYQIEIPTIIKLNIFPVHFHSKVNWSESSLALECVNFSRDIEIVEKKTGCFDSILIGDFNMNPYENGVVSANGIHAIQDLEYAGNRPKGREIDGIHYNYFYNPMWNFFGDFKKPFGTHYYRTSGFISQEWNIYDQVIFKASLKKFLFGDYVQIITNIAGENLIKAFNRPDKQNFSDHLPIIFKLII